jgi:Predicted membrane protein (DUF2157)
MNKEQLLQELYNKIENGEIDRQDVINKLDLGVPSQIDSVRKESKKTSGSSVTTMLYSLGAIIVILGIVIFVYQIWGDIGSSVRILITLGLGLIITALGSALLKSNPNENIGSIFHVIGGVLIPGGAMVLLTEFNIIHNTNLPIVITFAIISIFYYVLNLAHKNAILTFFSIVNTTAFIYLLVEYMIDNSYYYNHGDVFAYLTMATGLSYIFLAHTFRNGWNKDLVESLCFFGITGLLGAAFSRVFDSALWQTLYFIIIFASFYLAVLMKNKSILAVGTIFLIVHISYITGKYFANSIGWPVTLVVLGFIFIGLGYTSINISKKYIA